MNVLTPKGSAWWLSKSFATISVLIVLYLGVGGPLLCYIHCLVYGQTVGVSYGSSQQQRHSAARDAHDLPPCEHLMMGDSLAQARTVQLRLPWGSPSHLARLHSSAGQVKSSSPVRASYEFADLARDLLHPPPLLVLPLGIAEDVLSSPYLEPPEKPPSLTFPS